MGEVKLHGGPWHGRVMSLPDGANHLHIREVTPDAQKAMMTDEDAPMEIETRDGRYSAIAGRPGEFEWDGWESK